jgi:hypothetical protein
MGSGGGGPRSGTGGRAANLSTRLKALGLANEAQAPSESLLDRARTACRTTSPLICSVAFLLGPEVKRFLNERLLQVQCLEMRPTNSSSKKLFASKIDGAIPTAQIVVQEPEGSALGRPGQGRRRCPSQDRIS